MTQEGDQEKQKQPEEKPRTISAYIARFPHGTQIALRKLRITIRRAAPGAKETIAYQMPTFTFHGNLVHFAGYKDHLGFYPTPGAIEAFKTELQGYKTAKGSVQFPLDQPIPYPLIRRMVRYRVKENLQRAGDRDE